VRVNQYQATITLKVVKKTGGWSYVLFLYKAN
jgi:hypothetical protein